VDTVLSGAASVAQLHSNLTAPRVPPEAVEEVQRAVQAQGPAAYWAARGALAWN
jgi:hypothetical protein